MIVLSLMIGLPLFVPGGVFFKSPPELWLKCQRECPQCTKLWRWNSNMPTAITWSAQIHGAIRVIRLNSPRAVHFTFRVPCVFSGVLSQTEAPQLSCKSWPSCQRFGKLRSRLQGNMTRSSGLFFTHKLRCFWNWFRFWSFLTPSPKLHKKKTGICEQTYWVV